MIVVTRKNVTVELLRSMTRGQDNRSLSDAFLLETTHGMMQTKFAGFGRGSGKFVVRMRIHSDIVMVRSDDIYRYASGTLEELVRIIKENDYRMYDEDKETLL